MLKCLWISQPFLPLYFFFQDLLLYLKGRVLEREGETGRPFIRCAIAQIGTVSDVNQAIARSQGLHCS